MRKRDQIKIESPPQDAQQDSAADAKRPWDAGKLVAVRIRFRYALGWRYLLAAEWLQRQLLHEQAHRGGFLWVPVLIGSGSLLYFHLPREPLSWAFPMAAVAFALLARWRRGAVSRVLFVSLALIALGVSLAQWRVSRLATITLKSSVVAIVTGQVVRAELRADGRARYTLRVHAIDDWKELPQKVRLTSRKDSRPYDIGDVIAGRARLGPPPGPALPGGYDFRFFAWFDGIGGSGFFLGHPERSVTPEPGVAAVAAAAAAGGISLKINALRHQITHILRQALPAQSASLAAALIVGDRSGIDEATNEALRRSGLAHILAISGLHMALVSVTVIGLVRLIGAFHMEFAQRHSLKKWAGGLGLVFASAYLLVSGANVSAQRAYVMVAIMLVAVILDRRALTMRNVALAALVVLAFAPEALMHPGFQMSFAAVAALVSTFEILSAKSAERDAGAPKTPAGVYWFRICRYLFGLAAVPLIAGLSTGLFAAYHFYRIAPLGLLANLLAMPIVSVLVMPLALMSTVLMPFGLEQIALVPMGLALQCVVAIAQWVSNLSTAGSTGYVPKTALVLGSLGLMIATLCRSQLKWACIACFALSVLVLLDRRMPDAIISESGRQIGLLLEDGSMVLAKPDAEKFTTRLWREATARTDESTPSKAATHRSCDRFGCVLQKPGLVIVQLRSTARLSLDCRLADILVVPYSVPWACQFLPVNKRPIVIDAQSLRSGGAHSIYAQAMADNGQDEKRFSVQPARRDSGRLWQN
ncbi:MAG: ComEC family competence protein [Hyphomicrobiales bacterium]|nr:ComEC family competence protein [Hyphomicrobiales bacterium]